MIQILIPLIILFLFLPNDIFTGIFISEDKNIVFLAFLSIVTQKNILLNITYLNESSRRSEIAQFFEFLQFSHNLFFWLFL